MRSALLFLLLSLAFLSGSGQTDSVPVSDNRPDGLYLSYDDFRHNRVIGKDHIVTDINKDQLDFMGKVMNLDRVTYMAAAGTQTVDPGKVWGFYQNKTLYVNFRGEFFRVPVFGSICYLVATVTLVNGGFYDPMFGYGVNSTRTKEIREFMINFHDGIITEFNMERADQLLSRDPALYAEYQKLGRRKRREQVNRYIRLFNERHPVYFLR